MIIANWKMNKTNPEAEEFVRELLPLLEGAEQVEVILCPAYICLERVGNKLADTGLKLGAQNLFWEEKGAYTGEVSAAMLKDVGCSHVIIGHSERRQILGETDVAINWKVKAALDAGLVPILCVGETLQERENNMALERVQEQLTRALKDIGLTGGQLVVAYEPVWAIGTGVNASPDDAQEMIAFIRDSLSKLYSRELADSIQILYGGSVKDENITEFLAEEDVDGALVGGASLIVESFARIVRSGK